MKDPFLGDSALARYGYEVQTQRCNSYTRNSYTLLYKEPNAVHLINQERLRCAGPWSCSKHESK